MFDSSGDSADASDQKQIQCSSVVTPVHTSHAVTTAVTTTPAQRELSGASVTDALGRKTLLITSTGSTIRRRQRQTSASRPSCAPTSTPQCETLPGSIVPTTTEYGDEEIQPCTLVPEGQVLSALTVCRKNDRTSPLDRPKELPHHITTEMQMGEMMKHRQSPNQRPLKIPGRPSRTPSDGLPEPKVPFRVSRQISKRAETRTRSESEKCSAARRGGSNPGSQNGDDELLAVPKSSRIPKLIGLSHDVTVSGSSLTRSTRSRTTMQNSSAEDIAGRADATPRTAPSARGARRSATSRERRPTGCPQSTGVTPTYRHDGRNGQSGHQYGVTAHPCQFTPPQKCSEADQQASSRALDGQVASGLPGHHRRSVNAVEESSRVQKPLPMGSFQSHEHRSTPQPMTSSLYTAESLPSEQENSLPRQVNDQGMLSMHLMPLKIPSTSHFRQISSQNTTHDMVYTDNLQVPRALLDLEPATTPRLREQVPPAVFAARTSEESGDSPASSSSSHSDWRSSEGSYDTPLTSQCSSPVKRPPSPGLARPVTERSPALRFALAQFDGPPDREEHDSAHAVEAGLDNEHDENCSEYSSEYGSDQLVELHTLDPDVDLTEPFEGHNNASELLAPQKDSAPLVKACRAKGPQTAYPFPQSGSVITPRSSQRHPSKLMSHCEHNDSHRQRRMLAHTLETPDRFIPGRSGTPTKEGLLLRRPRKRLGIGATHRFLGSARTADPFTPTPTRTARMADRFATLRRYPTGTGPSSRAATLVPEARLADQRAVSAGAVWSVGGTIVTEGVASTTDGRGGRVTSGTSAPHYTAGFLRRQTPSEDEVQHGERLAVAMDIEQTARMFSTPSSSSSSPCSRPRRSHSDTGRKRTFWNNNAWETATTPASASSSRRKVKDVPAIPFRVLDAPQLRDDFYCSLLAYSHTVQCLAVGLGQHVYLWSENRGTTPTHIPDSLTAPYGAHVTSLSFSSVAGGSAILAIGRGDGQITLWSPMDPNPRFSSDQPAPVSCVCFRPNPVKRPSVREPGMLVNTEELLVGDEVGHVYYYSIEWPAQSDVELFDWQGSMTLLARLECHTQQICGIAWSSDGEFFATGGNDNHLFLYESRKVIRTRQSGNAVSTVTVRNGASGGTAPLIQNSVLAITPGHEKHLFTLNAAVKAIAFAPWQSSLIAAGGGSNDRCIHFFHAVSGASLATIDCYAQVTSLVWSEKKQEIAVTFGFAQPEHPYRVAVFAWPSCRRVVGIPWWGEERALSAVAYPGGPHGGPGRRSNRPPASGRGRRLREEGCLVVATSDASIKFHEIWPERSEQGRDKSERGAFGGGSILEDDLSPTLLRRTTIR